MRHFPLALCSETCIRPQFLAMPTVAKHTNRPTGHSFIHTVAPSKIPLIIGVVSGTTLLLGVIILVVILMRRIFFPEVNQPINDATNIQTIASTSNKSHRVAKQSTPSKKSHLVVSPASRLNLPPSLMDSRFGKMDSQLMLDFDIDNPTSSDLDAGEVPNQSAIPKTVVKLPPGAQAALAAMAKTAGPSPKQSRPKTACLVTTSPNMRPFSAKLPSPMVVNEKNNLLIGKSSGSDKPNYSSLNGSVRTPKKTKPTGSK